jgi:hypothetical protein
MYKEVLDSGEVTQSQTVILDDASHVPSPVHLPDVAAQQQLWWSGDQGVRDMDGDSDSKDKVQVHTNRMCTAGAPESRQEMQWAAETREQLRRCNCWTQSMHWQRSLVYVFL